ncbi:hypothetical protein [Amycolatopsis sp. H20-H5]|uniref:hypothetical protein n=1 Tax=Amycolatopsis sp. H20-H5 TaxID=3046309 RepID=UPI002DBCD33F|nr:hypothetical protein [Amycolatopsis sp. H20-H5]MEC3977784.1 hypothetical protein [Amycolatopsis sp. H20-H5]
MKPAQARAMWLLRNEIYTHLDEAELFAAECGPYLSEATETIRLLVGDLVAVVRKVVGQHGETIEGRCGFCGWPWPCESIDTIHQTLREPGSAFAQIANDN